MSLRMTFPLKVMSDAASYARLRASFIEGPTPVTANTLPPAVINAPDSFLVVPA